MEMEVFTPDSFLGDVMGLLNTKRARIMGMEASYRKGWQLIKAQVPWMEIRDFAVELKSATQGKATYTLKLSHYEEAPSHIANLVINETKKQQQTEVSS